MSRVQTWYTIQEEGTTTEDTETAQEYTQAGYTVTAETEVQQ